MPLPFFKDVSRPGARSGKTNGQDILRLRNIGMELRGEAVMEKLVGILTGQRVGRTDHEGYTLL